MPADWKPSLPYPPRKINYPVTSGHRWWISVWQTRDNLYKNCRLQTSTRPWWFYFCQIRFPTLPLKEFAFRGAKEQVSPYCWGFVNCATNTSKGRPLPQVRQMRGTDIVPTFGYSPRQAFPGYSLCQQQMQHLGNFCTAVRGHSSSAPPINPLLSLVWDWGWKDTGKSDGRNTSESK